MPTTPIPVRSSFLEAIEYDDERRALTVVMKGRTYVYENVPPEVIEELKQAPSQGAFYYRQIRGVY